MSVVKRICPVCSAQDWESLLEMDNGRIMTGDQRIIPGKLKKAICRQCGAGCNDSSFTTAEIERLYGREYVLNTLGREEHQFFTKAGPLPRSQVLFEWICPWLPKQFESLLEIGCGEGNLLVRFKNHFPGKKISGFEGSIKACELAIQKGLEVTCRMILSDQDQMEKADVIVCVAVLEHIEDISGFLHVLKASVPEHGRIIFCVPVQNYPGYDIFFAEHVWHMTTRHFKINFAANGLKCIHVDDSHPINHGMGLFVLEKNDSITLPPITSESRFVLKSRNQWLKIFDNINTWIVSRGFKRIALFGSGEVATLFLTFTVVADIDVAACIDEDPLKIGGNKHGIPIFGIDWLTNNSVDAVLLAINPKYHPLVQNKLALTGIELSTWGEERQEG